MGRLGTRAINNIWTAHTQCRPQSWTRGERDLVARLKIKIMENENKTQWVIKDMRTAPREFVEGSFQQEREWILVQAWQLLVDVSSANENRFQDNPIDINFDQFQERLEHLLKSDSQCPYFEIHKERDENGWL